VNRYPSEQLMTVEEAQRLSELHTSREERASRERRARIWAWQSVAGALEQTVTDEQVEQVMRTARQR
jgi:hypothetical protein